MSTDVNLVEMCLKNGSPLLKQNQSQTVPVVKVMKHPSCSLCLMPQGCKGGAAVVVRVARVVRVVPAGYNTLPK